ncbi:DNA translocase FtsK, partial [Magnetococcales bacterium HHB-1]
MTTPEKATVKKEQALLLSNPVEQTTLKASPHREPVLALTTDNTAQQPQQPAHLSLSDDPTTEEKGLFALSTSELMGYDASFSAMEEETYSEPQLEEPKAHQKQQEQTEAVSPQQHTKEIVPKNATDPQLTTEKEEPNLDSPMGALRFPPPEEIAAPRKRKRAKTQEPSLEPQSTTSTNSTDPEPQQDHHDIAVEEPQEIKEVAQPISPEPSQEPASPEPVLQNLNPQITPPEPPLKEDVDPEEPPPLPPLDLLAQPPVDAKGTDRTVLLEKAKILEQRLADFKVKGQIVDVIPGPVVTTFEFDPAPGLKASKVVGLAEDLA